MREPLVRILLLAFALGACAPHLEASLERMSASWAPEEGATREGDAVAPIRLRRDHSVTRPVDKPVIHRLLLGGEPNGKTSQLDAEKPGVGL